VATFYPKEEKIWYTLQRRTQEVRKQADELRPRPAGMIRQLPLNTCQGDATAKNGRLCFPAYRVI